MTFHENKINPQKFDDFIVAPLAITVCVVRHLCMLR
jgi:hypothetical protein